MCIRDSNSSIIKETGANRLDIRATNLILNNATNDKTYINCIDGAQVQLFHNGAAKLETASTGVTVTGNATATEFDGLLSTGSAFKTGAWYTDNSSTPRNRLQFVADSHSYYDSHDNHKFYVQGGLEMTIDGNGNVTATGNVTAYSDERLKSDIKTIDNALDKVSQMRGVTFIKDERQGSGVIAQEMEKIAPELVITAEDEIGTKSVAYGNTVGYLIEAIKELKSEIEELKKGK